MTGSFSDHFPGVSAEYARYRPRYPRALFANRPALARRAGAAWDCATGNGQAAAALAEHFERVIVTDASSAQIAPAPHWFDLFAFRAEARRVFDSFYDGAMGPYRPAERRLVEEGHRSLDFPFEELPPRSLSAEARLTLDEPAGFVRT